jgi:hypothetical protein
MKRARVITRINEADSLEVGRHLSSVRFLYRAVDHYHCL